MGRITGFDNMMGINIHVTKEFVDKDENKFIIGEQTNWKGDRAGVNWVVLEMLGDDDVKNNYIFASSEKEAILLSHINDEDLTDVNYDVCINFNRMIEEFTGWSYHECANSNFQTCVICSYMYYEALKVYNVSATLGEAGFEVTGDISDADTLKPLLHFVATPSIDAYDIKYYKDGKKIDDMELACIEASDICGIGAKDIDNAIYYVISNEIFDAIAVTAPIQITVSAIARLDDKNDMQLRKILGKKWVKDLFDMGTIDRFMAEFIYTMINKW